MSYVLGFTEFINESKINKMRRRDRSSYRPNRSRYNMNGSSEYYYVNVKDRMRAEQLTKRRSNSKPNLTDEQVAISNATKMAKLITDPGKLIARMVAVYDVYGPSPILKPFINRILELEYQHPKYVAAWRIGKADGEFENNLEAGTVADDYDDDSASHILADLGLVPDSMGFDGNEAEKIIYQVAKSESQSDSNSVLT